MTDHERIAELEAQVKAEHELYLTAHRDNMKGAALLMEKEAQVQALTLENAEQAKDLSLNVSVISNLRAAVALLEARERELAKEVEAVRARLNYAETGRESLRLELQAEKHSRLKDNEFLQSEKSLLTKAVEDAKSKCDLYGFVIDELEKNLSDFLTKLGKKTMPVGWARRTIDAALSPRQPQAEAECPDPEAHEKGDLLLPCDHKPQPPEER